MSCIGGCYVTAGPHPHYQGFADFGDAEGFRERLKQMRTDVKIA
jgi:hypothetical protein